MHVLLWQLDGELLDACAILAARWRIAHGPMGAVVGDIEVYTLA